MRKLSLCLLTLVIAAPLLLSACESKDVSFATSPSVLAMIGTAVGNTDWNPVDKPPATQKPASGWSENFGQASWTKLENGTPAIMVVIDMQAKPGAGMEMWLTKDSNPPKTIVHWFGGSTAVFQGTLCYQVTTQEKGAAVPIDPNASYSLTVDFLDANAGVVASQTRQVAGNTPHLTGHAPGPNDIVFATAYACPKGQ